jgi:hypothetical protein
MKPACSQEKPGPGRWFPGAAECTPLWNRKRQLQEKTEKSGILNKYFSQSILLPYYCTSMVFALIFGCFLAAFFNFFFVF